MIKFKLTKKQNNKLKTDKKLNMFQSVEAHYSDVGIELNYHINFMGKILALLTFPFEVIIKGLSNFESAVQKTHGVLFQEKTGNNYLYWIPSGTEMYESLEEIYLCNK